MDSTTAGFQLTASGYSHKLLELVRTVLAAAAALEIAEDRFQVQSKIRFYSTLC